MFRVPTESAQIAEQLGSREKYWFTSEIENRSYLYKLGRPETGEHWAEVVVARICDWLEIPHAEYQLATNGETVGVVTWSIVEQYSANRLIHGNEMLARTLSAYPEQSSRPGASYNLQDIYDSLKAYQAVDGRKAIAAFGDYLILDALVANQDRHHENWALLELPDGERRLGPTFDHAAALACRLTDREREGRLRAQDVGYRIERFAKRARTWFYRNRDSESRLPTLTAATEWLSMSGVDSRPSIVERLEKADTRIWLTMFENLDQSGITDTAIEFASALLECNTERLVTSM